jgi:hypothetical protein
LEHRQEQEVLEAGREQIAPVNGVDGTELKDAGVRRDLALAWSPDRLRDRGLGVLVIVASKATMPRVPSPRSRTIAASKERRLPRYDQSKRPGECAKQTSHTLPGVSGHQQRTARSASAWSATKSPNRLNANVGDHRRSAHSRW